MKKMYLGVAREDITPEVGGALFGYTLGIYSEKISDPLNLTSFAFSSGETKVIMINATICVICVAFCEEIKREVSARTGVPFENIIVSATHTHTGPSLADSADGWFSDVEYYRNIFLPAAISASCKAVANMQPVRVGIATGQSFAGVNRRQLTLDNEVILGQNPWAPFNTEMTFLSFKNYDGDTVANIVSYGAHATAAGCIKEVSRDWPGYMTDSIEAATGGLTAFFNGTMGDSGPRLSNGSTCGYGVSFAKEIGDIAARDALEIYSGIKEYKDDTVAVFAGDISIPLKPRVPLAKAVEVLESMTGKLSHIEGYIQAFYRKVKESYENGYEEKSDKILPQTLIRVGSVVFAPFPFEMFGEIGLRIDGAVSDLKVLTLSYTNGQLLYLPTEDQLCRGGHEVNLFRYSNVQQYADNTDYHLVLGTLKNVEELER